MDEKEAEIRADMKLGKLNAVGRVILFSDTRAADDRSHWEVVDVADLARLPSYVNKDHKMTPEERVMRSKLPYTSGAEHTSRIFARVSAGENTICRICAHDDQFGAYFFRTICPEYAHKLQSILFLKI